MKEAVFLFWLNSAERGFVMSLHKVYKDKHYPNMHYDIIQGPPID